MLMFELMRQALAHLNISIIAMVIAMVDVLNIGIQTSLPTNVYDYIDTPPKEKHK